jgi:hypothetical protein
LEETSAESAVVEDVADLVATVKVATAVVNSARATRRVVLPQVASTLSSVAMASALVVDSVVVVAPHHHLRRMAVGVLRIRHNKMMVRMAGRRTKPTATVHKRIPSLLGDFQNRWVSDLSLGAWQPCP